MNDGNFNVLVTEETRCEGMKEIDGVGIGRPEAGTFDLNTALTEAGTFDLNTVQVDRSWNVRLEHGVDRSWNVQLEHGY